MEENRKFFPSMSDAILMDGKSRNTLSWSKPLLGRLGDLIPGSSTCVLATYVNLQGSGLVYLVSLRNFLKFLSCLPQVPISPL